ncbi:MAG: helix-hairpin-helix domain-containing protein [Candidatus Latescibacteria bacterium]|nr:helix-hairpin-helix domain-containing protein [Candidatus Latescibacterota bacterium]
MKEKVQRSGKRDRSPHFPPSCFIFHRGCFGLSLLLLISCAFSCGPEALFAQEAKTVEKALDPETGLAHLDWLADLEARPMDVNRAPAEALSKLPNLSADQADRIVAWRTRHGPFRNVRELGKVEGMDEETVERLKRYLMCAQPSSQEKTSALRPITLQCRLRLWCPDGKEGHRLFTGWKIYSRTSLSAGERFRLGWVTDKDPEEAHAYDFVAGYAELRDQWGFDQIVVGDFRPGFGQGLLFSRSARSMDGLGLARKRSTHEVGYRASTETGALRGLFLRRTMGTLEAVLFGARTRSDALLNEAGEVTGFSLDGRHVTETEKARADALTEELVGARLQWHRADETHPGERAKIGLTLAHSRFRPALVRRDQERNHFDFIGSQIEHLSVDWDLFLFGLNVFGEAVCSPQAGKGLVAGWIWKDGRFILESLIRAYGRKFRSFHGSGFAVSGRENGNEIGTFHSVQWRIRRGSRLALYFDQYRRPWRSYLSILPTGGVRFGAELRHHLAGSFETLIRLRSSTRQTIPSSDGAYTLTEGHRRELRWEGRWRSGSRFRLKSRVEHVWADKERGSLLFTDVRFSPRKGFVLDGRLTFFDVSAYQARIYEFETGLFGMFSIRNWSGRGRRWVLLMKVPVGKGAFSMKYSRTRRLNAETEEIESAFGMQMDVAL